MHRASKRKTLQKIIGVAAVGATTPSSWVKPVVNAVVLPVHAQTSVSLSCTITAERTQQIPATEGTRASVSVTPASAGIRVTLITFVPFGAGFVIPPVTRLTDENGVLDDFDISVSDQVSDAVINVYLNLDSDDINSLSNQTASCILPLTVSI
jgi:hypothetical protein